jgi:hypothetical protein
MPAPVEAFVGPVDAAPLVARARELYPTARRVAVEGEAFVVLSLEDTPLFDQATRFLRRVLRSYFSLRFAKIPVLPVYIVLFPRFEGFDHYSSDHYGVPGKDNLGAYQRDRREIIVDLSNGEHSLPTISHEVAHAIIGDEWEGVPLWFNECVATVFESPRWVGEDIYGAKWSRRYKLLSDTLASPARAPSAHFDALFGMSNQAFRGIDPAVGSVATSRDPALRAAARARGALREASARYACVWLDDQGMLTPFYEDWHDHFASDPKGVAAFERVVHAKPADVQERWARWVLTSP